MKQSETWTRLQNLLDQTGWTWRELSEKLELSTGMLSMVKTGKRQLSRKAELRLAAAENENGLRKVLQTTLEAEPYAKRVHESQARYGRNVERERLEEIVKQLRQVLDRAEKFLQATKPHGGMSS